MTCARGGIFASLAVAACGAAAFLAADAEARAVHPFRSALAVRWGGGAGSDAFLSDLTRCIADAMATRCFSGVEIVGGDPAATGADLDFVVVLSDVVEATRFDDPIASVLEPDQPLNAARRVARFAITVDARLSARSTGALVHRERFVANVSRRPLVAGEDPQAVARVEAIDRIVLDLVRGFRCGSAKLDRRIRDALRDHGAAGAGPR